MATLFGLYPFLLKLHAGGGYQRPQFQNALKRVLRQVAVEIVKRSDTAKSFTVLPKRWQAERAIGLLNRCRELTKDKKSLNRLALAFLRWLSIRIMLRKLCQKENGFGQTPRNEQLTIYGSTSAHCWTTSPRQMRERLRQLRIRYNMIGNRFRVPPNPREDGT